MNCCPAHSHKWWPIPWTWVPRLSHEEIVSTARDIVTGSLMVADLEDRDWQASLGLIISGTKHWPRNFGVIVVPRGPHMHGYWLNGRVPGCTFQCQIIAIDDLPAIDAEIERMSAALYPEEVS